MDDIKPNALVAFEPKVAAYSKTAAALSDLRQRYLNIVFDVSTTAGLDAARKARAEVREYRTSLEKMRVEIKAPVIAQERLIDAEAQTITGALLELEKPIDAQIKVAEDKAEARRQEKARAEAARVAALKLRLATIERIPLVLVGASVETLRETVATMTANPVVDSEWDELAAEAKQVRDAALLKVQSMLTTAEAAAAESARLAADRERLEAERAEQRAKDEAAAAERKRLDAEAAAERKRQDDAAAVERKRLADEAAATKRENDRIAAENRRRDDAAAEDRRRAIGLQMARLAVDPRLAVFLPMLESYKLATSADAERAGLVDLCNLFLRASTPAAIAEPTEPVIDDILTVPPYVRPA
jgi:hypothetical protein